MSKQKNFFQTPIQHTDIPIALTTAIEELRDAYFSIVDRLDTTEEHNSTRDAKIALLYNAFPSNDIAGHQRYHQLIIDKIEETRKLRMAIQEKTYAGLVWAVIIAIVLSLYNELKRRMVGG